MLPSLLETRQLLLTKADRRWAAIMQAGTDQPTTTTRMQAMHMSASFTCPPPYFYTKPAIALQDWRL